MTTTLSALPALAVPLGLVVVAPPAMAANTNYTVATCTSPPLIEGNNDVPAVTLAVGETLTLNFTEPSNCAGLQVAADATFGTLTYTDRDNGSPATVAPGATANLETPTSVVFTVTAEGSADTFTFSIRNSAFTAIIRFFVVVGEGTDGGGGDGGSSAEATGDTPIPLWHQAYGRANSEEKCRDGWQPSWAQWANSNRGGWTCTRDVPAYGQLPSGSSPD